MGRSRKVTSKKSVVSSKSRDRALTGTSKQRSKMKVTSTKTSITKHSNRRRRITATGGQNKRSRQTSSSLPSSSLPTTSSVSINMSEIVAKPYKIVSLEPNKGHFDRVAAFNAIAVLGDGQKVISGGFRTTLMFPQDMKHYTDCHGWTTPLDTTAYKDNGFVVIGHDGRRDEHQYNFHFFETNGDKFKETNDDRKIKSITDSKVIAITSCDEKIYALCDTDPPSLRQFMKHRPWPIWSRQTGEDGQPLFRNPTCITSFNTTKGVRLVIADGHDDRKATILLLDGSRGKLIRSQQALSGGVVGLTTDENANIFVCYNSPNAISVMQHDLSNERCVYKSKNLLTNPSCMAYDKAPHQLLVVDNGHTLHKFQLSYK